MVTSTAVTWVHRPLSVRSDMRALAVTYRNIYIANLRQAQRMGEMLEQQGWVHMRHHAFPSLALSGLTGISAWGSAGQRVAWNTGNPARLGFFGSYSVLFGSPLNACKWMMLTSLAFPELCSIVATLGASGSAGGLPIGPSTNSAVPFRGTYWWGRDQGAQDDQHTPGLFMKSYRRNYTFTNVTDMHCDVDVWQMRLKPDFFDQVVGWQGVNTPVYGVGCTESFSNTPLGGSGTTYGDWSHYTTPLEWMAAHYNTGQIGTAESWEDPMASVDKASVFADEIMVPVRHWHQRLSAGKRCKLSVQLSGHLFEEDDYVLGNCSSGDVHQCHQILDGRNVIFFVKLRGPWVHEKASAAATMGTSGYGPTHVVVETTFDCVCALCPTSEQSMPEFYYPIPQLEASSGSSTTLASVAFRVAAGQEGYAPLAGLGGRGLGSVVVGGAMTA